MNIKNIIVFSSLLFACHAAPAPVTPTAPKTNAVSQPSQTVKLSPWSEVKSLGCTVYSPEDAVFNEWFTEENVEKFSAEFCDGEKASEDQECFTLFGKAFMNKAYKKYENGDLDTAVSAFSDCATNAPGLKCFRVFEDSLIETNNQVCNPN